MAFQTNTNTGSAFRPRQPGPAEYVGNADIDAERYTVSVGPVENGSSAKGAYIFRTIRFECADNGLVFTGRIFDQRLDRTTGQQRELNERAPQWSGNASVKINDELTVTKKIAAWERNGSKAGLYLFMAIRDIEVPAQAQQAAEPDPF